MAGKVFINHRRSLSEKDAEILFNRLVLGRHLPASQLFIDRRALDKSADWKAELKKEVHASEVMVVVIGTGWAELRNGETNQRRLDDPEDLVRYEIVEAIDCGIPLVPVLVNGAALPDRARLPLDLWPLTKPQTLELRTEGGARAEIYVAEIAKAIHVRLRERRRPQVLRRRVAITAMALAVPLGGAVGYIIGASFSERDPSGSIMTLRKQLTDERNSLSEARTALALARRAESETRAALSVTETKLTQSVEEASQLRAAANDAASRRDQAEVALNASENALKIEHSAREKAEQAASLAITAAKHQGDLIKTEKVPSDNTTNDSDQSQFERNVTCNSVASLPTKGTIWGGPDPQYPLRRVYDISFPSECEFSKLQISCLHIASPKIIQINGGFRVAVSKQADCWMHETLATRFVRPQDEFIVRDAGHR